MALDSTMIFVGLAVFFAGYVKGAVGMGFPLIATPMLTLILDIRVAVVVLVLPGLVMDLGQILRNGFPTATFRRFASMFFSTFVGVFLGTWELATLPLWTLNLIMGCLVTFFAALGWCRFDVTVAPKAESILSPVVGLVGGFLLGMSNVMGPPVALYLHSLKLDKAEFVKAIASAFIMAKFWQIIALAAWNLFTFEVFKLSLLVTAFILVSFYLGLKTQDRVDQGTFNRAILVLLSVIGVTLVYRALQA